MKKRLSGERYTARELAEQFGCDKDTIHNHAHKLFGPGEARKTRYFDDAQATMILERIKCAIGTGRKIADTPAAENIIGSMETPLSPLLKLKMIQEQKEALHVQEIAIYQEEIDRLKAAYEWEVQDHKGTKALLAERETGLKTIQRIAEAGNLIVTDREDIENTYQRKQTR